MMMQKLVGALALLVVLSGCSFEPPTMGPTATAEAELTPCAFVWATHSLEQETAAAQARLAEAGLEDVNVQLVAFGEDCVYADGRVGGFGVMSVDVYLAIGWHDFSDQEGMGNRLEQVLQVLLAAPADSYPANLQKTSVVFEGGNDTEDVRLGFEMTTAKQFLAEGKHGAAFLQALQAGN